MQLKIISDGTAHGTRVINAETGQIIQNVVGIEITIQPVSLVKAVITVLDVPLDLTLPDVVVQELHVDSIVGTITVLPEPPNEPE